MFTFAQPGSSITLFVMAATAMLRALLAAFMLTLLATACVAQTLTSKMYKSPHGESVQFHGDTVSFKYFPGASANCSQCYLAFKLGALSELDAVSDKISSKLVHMHVVSESPFHAQSS